mmetsp:Transcript_30953/g.69706  ORF Transcript_30953/g.69706 Transcript_30953/m.69706 type:complete len:307 (-) Transcript_30953:87-1007(-)
MAPPCRTGGRAPPKGRPGLRGRRRPRRQLALRWRSRSLRPWPRPSLRRPRACPRGGSRGSSHGGMGLRPPIGTQCTRRVECPASSGARPSTLGPQVAAAASREGQCRVCDEPWLHKAGACTPAFRLLLDFLLSQPGRLPLPASGLLVVQLLLCRTLSLTRRALRCRGDRHRWWLPPGLLAVPLVACLLLPLRCWSWPPPRKAAVQGEEQQVVPGRRRRAAPYPATMAAGSAAWRHGHRCHPRCRRRHGATRRSRPPWSPVGGQRCKGPATPTSGRCAWLLPHFHQVMLLICVYTCLAASAACMRDR